MGLQDGLHMKMRENMARMTPWFLTFASGWMMVPFTEIGNTARRPGYCFWFLWEGGREEFDFEYVESEVHLRHPRGDV